MTYDENCKRVNGGLSPNSEMPLHSTIWVCRTAKGKVFSWRYNLSHKLTTAACPDGHRNQSIDPDSAAPKKFMRTAPT